MVSWSLDSFAQGSPLITPKIIFLYVVFFLLFSLIVYIAIHLIRKPQNPRHIKNFLILSIFIKMIFIVVIAFVGIFYLVPSPKVEQTNPKIDATNTPFDSKIEIQFDRPVSRQNLEKIITPYLPGVWKFESGLYNTHFYSKLVFYPEITFLPDVEYKIELKNIKNLLGTSKNTNYSYNFKTEAPANIINITPANQSDEIPTDSKIYIELDKENNGSSGFNFTIDPKINLDIKLAENKKYYELTPQEKFKQSTTYKISVTKFSQAKDNLGRIIYVGSEKPEFMSEFKTKNSPQISSYFPSGDHVFTNSVIKLAFTKAMVRGDVQNKILFEPKINGTIFWEDDSNLTIKPSKLLFNTNYKIIIPKGILSRDRSNFENDTILEFKTIGPVTLLTSSSVSNDNSNFGVNNALRFSFDQEVDHKSAEQHFSIDPKADGSFSWDQNTLIYKPNNPLQYDTNYNVSFSIGIKSIHGQTSAEIQKFNFTTESFVFKLAVPTFLQKYSLSCETAALRMMLAFRGVNVDEDTLLSQIGYDNTPKTADSWGDPFSSFVGDPKGRQMITGYGVYWDPIARVAKQYRQAQAFSNSNISDLTNYILNGNPVEIWIYSKGGTQTSWKTSANKKINAVFGEHTVVVKGFVGKQNDPKKIIINDPLIGEFTIDRAEFDLRWNSLDRSGVVLM